MRWCAVCDWCRQRRQSRKLVERIGLRGEHYRAGLVCVACAEVWRADGWFVLTIGNGNEEESR